MIRQYIYIYTESIAYRITIYCTTCTATNDSSALKSKPIKIDVHGNYSSKGSKELNCTINVSEGDFFS